MTMTDEEKRRLSDGGQWALLAICTFGMSILGYSYLGPAGAVIGGVAGVYLGFLLPAIIAFAVMGGVMLLIGMAVIVVLGMLAQFFGNPANWKP